jgi:protein SCO1/2
MTKRGAWVAMALAGLLARGVGIAGSADAAGPIVPRTSLVQRLGATLPLDAPFIAADARAVRLRDLLATPPRRPAILVLGYARCPRLCGLLTQGVLEALQATGRPAGATRLVFVSIDPQETPADAAVRQRIERAYARFLAPDGPWPALDVLVGPRTSVDALARAVGMTYVATPDDGDARFAHPAAALVVTPDGRVSRYLMGVRFDAGEMRLALDEAGDDRVGAWSDRLALLCAHLDPRAGRWNGAVILSVRLVAVATLAALAALAWRLRARGHRSGAR